MSKLRCACWWLMSNHAFLSVRGRLRSTDKIEADLREIVERRFKGFVKVVTHKDREGASWEVCVPELALQCSWYIWRETQRKLETRHSMGALNWWTQTVVTEELAVLYDGTLSDEGIPDRWKGDASKYPTLKSYMGMVLFRAPEERKDRELAEYRKIVPAELIG